MGEIWSSLVGGMGWLLNEIYLLTEAVGFPSYAVAIVFFTVLVKTVLFPLTLKQMRSMKALQEIQPKIKKIQEKQKDPQKAQQEIMQVYKEHGANPFSGCLLLLVQMPFLIALYQALRTEIPKTAMFMDISLSKNISTQVMQDGAYILLILPVLVAASTYLSTRLSSNMTDQTQKMMLYIMPVFIGYISYTLPAGLGIYWVTFSLVGAAQQYFINKMPLTPKKEEAVAHEGARKDR